MKVRRRVLGLVAYILFLLILFEGGMRLFLWIKGGSLSTRMGFVPPQYAELAEIWEQRLEKKSPGAWRVLLLGGSVIHPQFGSVEKELKHFFRTAGVTNIQVFNASHLGHTSRDSRLKLDVLADVDFDAVVVYHGINELRANNCPPDLFRPDYAHYLWYEQLAVGERHRFLLPFITLPYCMDFLYCRVRQLLHPERYVPIGSPPKEWLAYGENLKTTPVFRSNLNAIVESALQRGQQPVLLTFAYYIPSNYSFKAFMDKQLDYEAHEYPVEFWGRPPFIRAGLDAHNEVAKELSKHPNVVMLDMKASIPEEGYYFDDLCHLSEQGCKRFAEVLGERLLEIYHGSR